MDRLHVIAVLAVLLFAGCDNRNQVQLQCDESSQRLDVLSCETVSSSSLPFTLTNSAFADLSLKLEAVGCSCEEVEFDGGIWNVGETRNVSGESTCSVVIRRKGVEAGSYLDAAQNASAILRVLGGSVNGDLLQLSRAVNVHAAVRVTPAPVVAEFATRSSQDIPVKIRVCRRIAADSQSTCTLTLPPDVTRINGPPKLEKTAQLADGLVEDFYSATLRIPRRSSNVSVVQDSIQVHASTFCQVDGKCVPREISIEIPLIRRYQR